MQEQHKGNYNKRIEEGECNNKELKGRSRRKQRLKPRSKN